MCAQVPVDARAFDADEDTEVDGGPAGLLCAAVCTPLVVAGLQNAAEPVARRLGAGVDCAHLVVLDQLHGRLAPLVDRVAQHHVHQPLVRLLQRLHPVRHLLCALATEHVCFVGGDDLEDELLAGDGPLLPLCKAKEDVDLDQRRLHVFRAGAAEEIEELALEEAVAKVPSAREDAGAHAHAECAGLLWVCVGRGGRGGGERGAGERLEVVDGLAHDVGAHLLDLCLEAGNPRLAVCLRVCDEEIGPVEGDELERARLLCLADGVEEEVDAGQRLVVARLPLVVEDALREPEEALLVALREVRAALLEIALRLAAHRARRRLEAVRLTRREGHLLCARQEVEVVP
mmetsp:Transcript_15550/g.60818  ORF Transcript_15550/g.60818 Transcript_15550/m.60818 type:complete len:345 (-) Transcript_15550:567-1601(-)